MGSLRRVDGCALHVGRDCHRLALSSCEPLINERQRMISTRSDLFNRLGATAAVLSGLVWLALTPFMATVGICQGRCGFWGQYPLIVRTLGRKASEWGWIPAGA